MKVFFPFLFYLLTSNLDAQDYTPVMKSWNNRRISKIQLHSYKSFSSKLENDIVLYTNLVRSNSKLFLKTILIPYLLYKGDTIPDRYINSLIYDLNHMSRLNLLENSEELTLMAREYSKYAGQKGIEGHENFNGRFEKLEKAGKTVGENCSYGEEKAIDIFMQLLIYRAVPNLGHRKNILSKNFKFIGVGFSNHIRYRFNAVIEFSN